MKDATYNVVFPKDECWDNKDPDDDWVDGFLVTDEGEKFVEFIGKHVDDQIDDEEDEGIVLDPFTEEQAVKYFESIGYNVTMVYDGGFRKLRSE